VSDEKVYMLNVLWFEPEGGAEKYAEYSAAAAPFVQKLGGRFVDGYVPEMAVIGDWKPDAIFAVEWPDWDAFTKLPQDPGYLAIAHLREEAITDSLLIRCKRMPSL